MTRPLPLLTEDEVRPNTRDGAGAGAGEEAGFGALRTARGLLPLKAMDVRGRLDGLLAQVTVRQTFVNVLEEPLEATYIFPLPDRAAVTGFRMEVAGRVVEGVLEERAQARRDYHEAIAAGHRASIAEEERPGVFTMRVGNLPPREQATVELTLAGPLPFADGEVTFRFPLVVAPRYIPGTPLPGPSVGDGVAVDTDAVPDASRISPPVLLPGFPNPVRLSLAVEVHESLVEVGAIRSSLHAVVEEDKGAGYRRISIQPGERLNRDVILRYRLGSGSVGTALSVHPDAGGANGGTFALTLVPPSASASSPQRPRDIVFVLDRSGSMEGWKMVAARRALARLVDTLAEADCFHVLAFDDRIERPAGFPASSLVAASDRQRFRAVEFLATIDARGGTELAEPLDRAVTLLGHDDPARDRILVLVTDGQVGNEDQILKALAPRVRGVRIFALGIDRAVNEAFLRRLAGLGDGSCDVVESEDRLDEVMDAAHRRIGSPVLTGLGLEPLELGAERLPLVPDSLVPERIPDLFPAAPMLVLGRYRGTFPDEVTVRGRDTAGEAWSRSVPASVRDNPAIASVWARGQVRKLEDRYVAGQGNLNELEKAIVATSLEFGVLCRFTAFVAVDRADVVNPGGQVHRITQPVELPDGWAAAPAASRGPIRAYSTRLHGMMPPLAVGPVDACELAMSPPTDQDESAVEHVDSFLSTLPDEDLSQPLLPEMFRPRVLEVLELLATLRTALGAGEAAILAALRALRPRFEALQKDWVALGGSPATGREFQKGLETFLRLLRKRKPPVADLLRVSSQLETLLAAAAGGPASGEDPRRQAFWK